jgi:TonB family protein
MAGTDRKSRLAAWEKDVQKNPVPPLKASDFPAGEITAPRTISTADLKYTSEARSGHVEGKSVLSVVVDTTGTARDVAIIQPLGLGLDEQAVMAVKKWHFTPSTLNGQPVPVRVNIEVNFHCCP